MRALPSKFGRRSGPCHGPCQIMALREHPSKFTGRPGPLLSPPLIELERDTPRPEPSGGARRGAEVRTFFLHTTDLLPPC